MDKKFQICAEGAENLFAGGFRKSRPPKPEGIGDGAAPQVGGGGKIHNLIYIFTKAGSTEIVPLKDVSWYT